jgi:hypothetical protein
MTRVQAIRGVGFRGGWSYSAWGLYEPRQTADGRWVWRLVASGTSFRSDKRGRHMWAGVPVDQSARNGSPCPVPADRPSVAELVGLLHDTPEYMVADRLEEASQ